MQDKKSFGIYIAEKRKKANLTQEELAKKLFVISSTISKWERGITYPDITMITNLCKELNISEHEFFTACDDEALDKEKKTINMLNSIKKWTICILNVSYLIGLVICLICNYVIDGKLSWFYIALVSVAISFTVTCLPFYLSSNKFRVFKVSIVLTLLIYILLFVINFVTLGNWFLSGFKISFFVLAFYWLCVLVCIFTKISVNYKVSVCLILLSFVTFFTNPFCARVLNIFNNGSNIPNVICGVIMDVVAIGFLFKKKRI